MILVPFTKVIADLLTHSILSVCTWLQVMFGFPGADHTVLWTWLRLRSSWAIIVLRKGAKVREKKKAFKSNCFKITFVYKRVTMGLFLTVSKSRNKIRL